MRKRDFMRDILKQNIEQKIREGKEKDRNRVKDREDCHIKLTEEEQEKMRYK